MTGNARLSFLIYWPYKDCEILTYRKFLRKQFVQLNLWIQFLFLGRGADAVN